ncbi:hypothetical protein BH10PAT3_BH10PAT3_7200 [soil metagenome]
MKYPNYEFTAEEQATPVLAMAQIVAARELRVRKQQNIATWSEKLGNVCLLFAEGHDARVRSALKNTGQTCGIPDTYTFLPKVITFRNNRTQLQREQQLLHGSVVRNLDNALRTQTKDKLYTNRERGAITELTALGILTRYAHPWIIALPALPHHEADINTPDHFDIGIALQEGGRPEKYLLQVKTSCTGRCGCTPRVRVDGKYASSIQLVSGCCDLGFKNSGYNPADFSVSRTLVAEFDELATNNDIKQLDVLSDNLLFNVTADLMPRGSFVRHTDN